MKYIYLYGGAIGDSLVGIHLGRTLRERKPGARLILLSTRPNAFVRELAGLMPFLDYRELVKDRPSTWWQLLTLALAPSAIFAFEPTDVPLPPWWRLILALATWLPGSREARSQTIGHERSVPARVTRLIVTPDDNLFSVNVPRIIRAWGIEPGAPVAPSLPAPECAPAGTPYIHFHFFAGNYRRSFPLEKVRPLLEQARALFPEYEFVLTATPAEEERARAMADAIPRVRVEAHLSATELLCLIEGSALCVGVASGVTHIAAHTKTPVIALANLSDPYWLPTYRPDVVILADTEHCRCQGNKMGDCTERTPTGDVFRCLYYIETKTIIDAMRSELTRTA